MSFLSKNDLKIQVDRIFPDDLDRTHILNDAEALQPSSFELRLGKEVYISREGQLIELGFSKFDVNILPGDFAILLTLEKICVPKEYMGFISIKRTYKDMGLVNISGFHVDPGFTGRLTFSVYNAGPNEIKLRYEQPLFILFLAQLTSRVDEGYKRKQQEIITTDSMNRLGGKSISPYKLEERIVRLETQTNFQWGILIAILATVLAMFATIISGRLQWVN